MVPIQHQAKKTIHQIRTYCENKTEATAYKLLIRDHIPNQSSRGDHSQLVAMPCLHTKNRRRGEQRRARKLEEIEGSIREDGGLAKA